MKAAAVIIVACVAFVVSTPQRAQAGCAGDFEMYLKHPDVVAIFRGTVTAVQSLRAALKLSPESTAAENYQIATLRVSTVWKGEVPPRTALHFARGEGNLMLALNAEYLVIAHELSVESRRRFGLPITGERALGSNEFGCGVRPIDTAVRLIGGAVGYPPK